MSVRKPEATHAIHSANRNQNIDVYKRQWLLGFSDITALHNLFQKNGYASLHSLMARHLTVEPEDDLDVYKRQLAACSKLIKEEAMRACTCSPR